MSIEDTGTRTGRSGSARAAKAVGLDRIACDGCGRWFSTIDGARMLESIKGRCPDCGGTFGLSADRASR